MALGQRIKQVLDERGLQRSWLMDKIPELSPQALSNLIVRDSKRSEWDEKIAEALGVSLVWLVYGRMEYEKASVRSLGVRENEPAEPVRKIVSLLQTMNRDGQFVALGRVEELAPRPPISKPTRPTRLGFFSAEIPHLLTSRNNRCLISPNRSTKGDRNVGQHRPIQPGR